MHSASFASRKTQELNKAREDQRQEKREKRLKLTPAGDIVAAQFKKEVDLLIYSPYPDEDKMSDEQFRTERRARRLAVASLLAIQNRINILLKAPGEEA